ncbi:DEAD/DEAH box helicase domain protein [Gluconacetobacter diazotrophicus PA1 5]|uniref:DEAD/DEAH box helicase n=1 Tax=Gluconacetobacter diazotrophicus TaxID=33996 RepID=UPI000173D4A4|nr:DEAD/DEAH box helicase [Gluconacetobacter diazotrophicus]ACI53084.1 DEAD/DEAH box helicase domain protein [Gluconacetobacter diazotrophicus PA1 5]TWB07755.1 ATP-dependent RNA helicase RhlE [Gluconacetobacter diazotrophicus]
MTDTAPLSDPSDIPAFDTLGLDPRIVANVARAGYATPSPIQALAIPPIRDGRDVEALARTGTGKTAAFALPVIHRLLTGAGGAAPSGPPGAVRALILSPTRELASQTAGTVRTCIRGCGLTVALAIGGAPKDRQARALLDGVDILVATPGRLLDHLADATITLDHTTCLVLDEADRMLDLGFVEDVRAIAARLPVRHQTLLFSATMSPAISALGRQLLHKPLQIAPPEQAAPPPRIRQQVIFTPAARKAASLLAVLRREAGGRTMVFTRTKQAADALARTLNTGGVTAAALHGDHGQVRRDRTLDDFRRGRLLVLVATDVMARGIDVEDVALVVNFDIPEQPETYIHRIGRTARAGRRGTALSLCDPAERLKLRDIERQSGARITVIDPT